MNAEQLLAHYERIAEAPDAIARLRRFVLDLAMRGKLVEQQANDETAEHLLHKIAAAKANGLKSKAQSVDVPPEFPLPDDWCWAPLIALGRWAIGSGFPKQEQGETEGDYFFLKVSDMNLPGNEKYVTTANNLVSGDGAARMKAKLHPAGTIIFPKIGGAIATNKRRILTRPCAIDNNCLGITFSDELNLEWAYLLLTSIDFAEYQAGTAVPALQQGTLEAISIAVPPLAEQHRIVDKVGELMALCDRLEEARTEQEAARDRLTAASLARLNAPDPDPATFTTHARFALDHLPALTTRADQIKQLRQTILNLAVRGKLVEQDATDEPASELLKQILDLRKKMISTSKVKKMRPAVSPGEETEVNFPTGWAASPLQNLTDPLATLSYGVLVPGPDVEDGVPFVRAQDLMLAKHPDKPGKTIAHEIEAPFAKTRLRGGEILLCVVGSIGKLGVVPPTWAGANIARAVVRIAPIRLISSAYLLLFFQSDSAQNFFLDVTRTLAQPTLNIGLLEKLPVSIPPRPEQDRIVAKVHKLMALCDQLEAYLAAGDETRQRLLEAILHQALEPAEARELEPA